MKYAAAVASPGQIEFYQHLKKSSPNYLRGVTWLMNHWCFKHHPDHFTMKLLEVRGLMANRGFTNEQYYSALPAKIDQLVSMDYPLLSMTDYEKFIMKVVYHSFGKPIKYFTLNVNEKDIRLAHDSAIKLLPGQYLYSSCDYKENYESFRPKLLAACQDDKDIMNHSHYIRLPYKYAEQVYLSPRYKNNIPSPYNLTMRSFRESVASVLPSFNSSTFTPTNKLVVAILSRINIYGLRQILNFNEVHRLVQKVLGVSEINLWYIDETMSPEDQIFYFQRFDILISTHSSQLTNLIFSKENAYVIEIQAENNKIEPTFQSLATKVGVNHYMLNRNLRYETHGFSQKDWRQWDYYVNLTELQRTLETIKMNIQTRIPHHL